MTVLYSGRKGQRVSLFRASWVVPTVFVALALLLTWPLVAHLSTRLPGTATWAFDESTFVWNIWYFKHALLDLHRSPLHTDLIWFPLGIDLILYTFNFFNAIVALPLQVALNLPLASNLTLLLATVLSGYGTYLLALYVLRGRREPGVEANVNPRVAQLAAVLAGIIYAFASNRAVYAALGHYDMVTTQWLPFYVLYLLKTLHRPGYKNAVMAGLFFALAALAEMIFASFLALFSLTALVALWRRLRDRRAVLGRLCVAALTAALIWSPVLVPVAREFLTGDYALEGWGESIDLSADLVGLVTPTDLNPLFQPARITQALAGTEGVSEEAGWMAALRAVQEDKGRFTDINTVFLGYATLTLALLGVLVAPRGRRVWSWNALLFGVFTLGPLLQINGRYRFNLDGLLPEGVTFPLPFALLHFVPFLNANRAPNRNSVMLMLALSMLAAYGICWLLGRAGDEHLRRGWKRNGGISAHALRLTSAAASLPIVRGRLSEGLLAAGLATVLILEHLAVPLPTTDARVPEVYRQIAAEPGQFAVMQLPLGWRNSFGVLGSERTQIQYYQTAHGKPIIGGNISRAPEFKIQYFERIPLFRALTLLEMYDDVPPEMDAAARAQAAELMALYDVRYFIMFPPIPGAYPYQDTWQRTQAYALDVLPLEQSPFWEEDGIKAYRVLQPPLPFPFRLDMGTANTEPYLGEGWDLDPDEQPFGATATWAISRNAELYLPLAEPSDVALRLAVAPLTYPGAPEQILSISVNDTAIPVRAVLSPGWQTVTVPVPAEATRRGPNKVRLSFAWATSPRQVLPDPTQRAEIGNTGVVSPVNLEVHSFDEAYITAEGPDGELQEGSAGRRGYNVAVFDPVDGRLLDMQGFDTAANTYEADRLARYLKDVPDGQLVVLGTKGDATAHVTPELVRALQRLGSSIGSAEELSGQAHALVGIQGSAPGIAAEAIAPGDAFLRVAGDFRRLAAAVDWVELGR